MTRVAVLALLLAGLVLDALVPAPGLDDLPEPEPGQALAAGSAVCAAVGGGERDEVTALTVSGPVPDALAAEEPRAELRTEAGGEILTRGTIGTDGTVGTLDVGPGVDGRDPLLALRWRAAPTVLARSWRAPSGDDLPGGLFEGPCPVRPDDAWVVPGLATAGGAAARLHLANPFDGTATATVSFTTPLGPLEPTRLRNVVVPAHDTVTLDLNDFAPEEPDLGVVVDVVAGRLAVEATQIFSPAIGGVEGASLVRAATASSEEWTVPYVRLAGDEASAWLWVTNPGERAAEVRLTVHGEDGPQVPPDVGLVVAPGTTERLDLTGIGGGVPVGITLRTNEGAPVVVSGTTVFAGDDPATSGLTVVAGSEASSTPQVGLVAPRAGRILQLHVVNPTTDPATVDVTVAVDGTVQQPPELQGLVVPAGSRTRFGIGEYARGGDAVAVTVTPTEGAVVAALLSRNGRGSLELVAQTLVQLPTFAATTPLGVRRDGTLLSRTGTPLGTGPGAPTTGVDPLDQLDDPLGELPDDPLPDEDARG